MRGIHHLQPVVIVDEGHLLDREMLEEVRILLNYPQLLVIRKFLETLLVRKDFRAFQTKNLRIMYIY